MLLVSLGVIATLASSTQARAAEAPSTRRAARQPATTADAADYTPVRGMARIVAKPSNTRATRQAAFDAIPFDKLDRATRSRARAVLAQSSIFRRLPTMTVDCDPALFTFLANHPHVIVSIWEALGISEVGLSRSGPDHFVADDGLGTKGEVEFLYRGDNVYLIHAKGSYEGALFASAVRGQCLLLLQTQTSTQANGRPQVTCRLDAFITLENAGWEMLAKTFQPLVGSTADHNFKETTAFISSLSRAAELNYSGIHLLARKLDNLSDTERSTFKGLTEGLAMRSALADAEFNSQVDMNPDTAPEPPQESTTIDDVSGGPALISPATEPRRTTITRRGSSTRQPTTVRVQKR